MMATPNLAIPHIGATDIGKYAEANTAISSFDGAYAGNVTLSYNPSGAFNITSLFLLYMVFIFPVDGLLTSAGTTVVLPAHARPFVVINNTGVPLDFMVGTGAEQVT